MKKENVLLPCVAYVVMVFLAEITIGNPRFPINIWFFTEISPWQWSVPVHLAGFIWMAAINWLLAAQAVTWPILLSTLFFLAVESLNWFFFGFFAYAAYPLGAAFSFWLVILLYACLTTVCSLLLRGRQKLP